ncbi:MAG: hypothetical protein ACI38Q_06305 [Candidatus Bruticola sp.]
MSDKSTSKFNWRKLLAPSKNWHRVIYLVVVFVLFLFLQAEIYLRVHGYAPGQMADIGEVDPLYDLQQLTDHISFRGSVISSEDPNVIEHTNPDTSRRSSKTEKTDYDSRVLVVGCSQTYGMGVADEQTLVWLLNEHYPRTRFDNFGVKGYGTLQCLLMMQYWLERRNYNGVIYYFIKDHGRRNSKYYLLPGPNKTYRQAPYADFDIFGNLRTYPYYKLENFASLSSSAYTFFRYYYYLAMYSLYQHQSELKQQKRYNKLSSALIEEMRKTADRHHVKFVAFNMDPELNPEEEYDAKCGLSPDLINIGNDKLNSNVYRVGGQSGNHPNGVVHAYWAKKTIEWIDKNNWLNFSDKTNKKKS